MRRLEAGALPPHETSNFPRRKARRKIIRRLMHIPDDADDAQCWCERDTQMADCVHQGRPSVMRVRRRLYDRFEHVGVGIGDEPHFDWGADPRCDVHVQYIGMYAGRGAMEITARAEDGGVAMLIEKDPVGIDATVAKVPERTDSRGFRRRGLAQLGAQSGGGARHVGRTTVCGPCAPSGKGLFLSDPGAWYLLGMGTAACMGTVAYSTHRYRPT